MVLIHGTVLTSPPTTTKTARDTTRRALTIKSLTNQKAPQSMPLLHGTLSPLLTPLPYLLPTYLTREKRASHMLPTLPLYKTNCFYVYTKLTHDAGHVVCLQTFKSLTSHNHQQHSLSLSSVCICSAHSLDDDHEPI